MSDSYFFGGSFFGKYWKKRLFFRADMAGFGKYCKDENDWIGVYRINIHGLLGSWKRTTTTKISLFNTCIPLFFI